MTFSILNRTDDDVRKYREAAAAARRDAEAMPICPGCGEPAHASESDDDDYHEGCRAEDREGK